MKTFETGGVALHYQESGDRGAPALVFSNSLGTDMRVWDAVIERMPPNLHILRYDKRGHGLSDCPDAPYSMGALVRDIESLMDHLHIRDCVFVGLSIGGMIAQGLAAKRLDLVRGVVLSNTAAKIATRQIWGERIEAVRKGGIEALADATMERWFSKPFRESGRHKPWRHMMTRQPIEGYIGCSAAIAGTDFITPTSGLTLPTLGIAGAHDASTPPDLVRETVDLIRGSEFHLIKSAGHIPCVEAPDEFAELLVQFLKRVGHVTD